MPYDSCSDAELWADCADGDTRAFAQLFDRHRRAVYNYSFRRTGDWSDAEEILSATFMTAWRRRREVTFERDSALPWLLGVATNLSRARWRKKRRYEAALSRADQRQPNADPSDAVAARIDDERRMQRILKVVDRLPEHERDVLTLAVFAELTYEEIACSLEIPVGTVRSRLSRARSRVRSMTAVEHSSALPAAPPANATQIVR